MKKSDMREILKRIDKKSTKKKNGCLIWNGPFNSGSCMITYNYKTYVLHRLIWNMTHPKNILKRNEKCIRTCNNKKCIKIEHIAKESYTKIFTKQEVWNKIRNNCYREPNKDFDKKCRIWKGPYEKGYGSINTLGAKYSAHKVSYWCKSTYENIKDIPLKNKKGDTLVIRHLCNNSKCCEPTHLKLGTQHSKNMLKDKLKNGTLNRGEKHPNSKITYKLAKKIKLSKYPQNDVKYKTQQERANLFNVSVHIVADIDRGKTWGEIPDINGNIVNRKKQRKTARKQRKNANNKIWDKKMFKNAKYKLYSKTKLNRKITGDNVSTPCRIFQGALDKNQYGRFNIEGKEIKAHIMACEIKYGRHKKDNEYACHKCDNPSCCRVSHMYFGTVEDNSNDRVASGNNHFTKISDETILEIRNTYKKDGLTQKQRAKKYKISTCHLRDIEKYRTRKNLIPGDQER